MLRQTELGGGSSSSSSGSDNNNKNNSRGQSIVEDRGVHRTTCGYCKSKSKTSTAHGLLAYRLTVDDYQDLLDRGWRRSGRFLYKPEMEKTCCPPYTIRLKVDSFVPSKEQTRVYRRMQRFLDGFYDGPRTVGDVQREHTVTSGRLNSSTIYVSENAEMQHTSVTQKVSSDAGNLKTSDVDETAIYISRKIDEVVKACVESGELPAGISFPFASVKKMTAQRKQKLKELSKGLECSSNISFQIAAILNRRLIPEKLQSAPEVALHGQDQEEKSKGVSPVVIAEKLATKLGTFGGLPGFLVQSCNGHLNFLSCSGPQDSGQNPFGETSTPQQCTASSLSKTRVEKTAAAFDDSGKHECLQRRSLEICMKRSSFDPEEFALYKKYQIRVHNDSPEEVKESSYKRFLVDTPLIFVPPTNDNTVPSCGFGSFHQQYLIDGKLVAVGVVDILPRCLSSKYLFWDPDLAFLSLGKYSALQEIKWVQEAQKHCPPLQYYYLGYYIHSCPKMRYKAAYSPSELLCPVRYQWVSFDLAKLLLDKKSYVCLSDYHHAEPILSPVSDERHESFKQDHEMEDASELHNGDELIEFQSSDSSDESTTVEHSIVSSDDDSAAEDISDVLIQLYGLRRYKDLQALGLSDHGAPDSLARHLRKYVKAVGPELSRRMAYCLG